MMEITFFGAAAAGLLSFLTPCVMPLVPFYLSYLGGMSVGELHEGGVRAGARRRMILSAVVFAFGVTLVFMLLGMGATALGQVFGAYLEQLRLVAAAILVVFGLHFLGLIHVPIFYREARVQFGGDAAGFIGSFALGLAFGFGWTPCVGPALTSVLIMASGMDQVWQGGALLFVYGAAMTAPFVLAAAFSSAVLGWFARHRWVLAYMERIAGVMLLVMAALIGFDRMYVIADWMIWAFPSLVGLG